MCIAYITCITYIACMHAHVRKYVHALHCIAFHGVTVHIVQYIFLHYITLRILIHPSRMNTYIHMTINIALQDTTYIHTTSHYGRYGDPLFATLQNLLNGSSPTPSLPSQKTYDLNGFLCFPWIVVAWSKVWITTNHHLNIFISWTLMVQSSISFGFRLEKKSGVCEPTLLVDDQKSKPLRLQFLRGMRADQTQKMVVYLNQLQM